MEKIQSLGNRTVQNKMVKYVIVGVLFGCCFPLFATLMDLFFQGFSLSFANIQHIQAQQPLHWIINTAPLFLGLLAGLAGKRQDMVAHLNAQFEGQVETLLESEERFKRLSDASFEGIFLHDRGKIVEANDAFAQLIGYSCGDDVIGLIGWKFIAPKDLRMVLRHIRSGYEQPFEVTIVSRWGTAIQVEVTGRTSIYEGRQVGIVAVRDIGERKVAEETLNKLSSAINQTADVVMITDREGLIEYVNPAFEKLTGYALEEALGQTPSILKSGEHDADFYKNLWSTIKSGNVHQATFTDRKKNGDLFYVDHTISPVTDASDNLTHFVSVWRDVTQQREAEGARHQLERQLIQSERMASVGMVAAGIVHNLRSPLTGILGFAAMLQRKQPDFSELEHIVSSAHQMKEMIENILDKSRHRTEVEEVNLNVLLERELEFLCADSFFKIEVNLKTHFVDDIPLVMGGYSDFSQVFGNLLRNAVEAMFDCAQKELHVETSVIEGRRVVVDIRDTGCGIDDAHFDSLFEPFYTTKRGEGKDTAKGTGLGLYMVQQLLERYEATIRVESEIGKGALFRVTLSV